MRYRYARRLICAVEREYEFLFSFSSSSVIHLYENYLVLFLHLPLLADGRRETGEPSPRCSTSLA